MKPTQNLGKLSAIASALIAQSALAASSGVATTPASNPLQITNSTISNVSNVSNIQGLTQAALNASTLQNAAALAMAGGSDRGGGDVQCDALIRDLARNLKGWIQGGGPKIGQLDLSSTLDPATGKPYTYDEYDSSMLALLALPLDVSCVGQGDPGYPVSVDDSTKICASSVDQGGVHMVCDRALFLGLSTDLQIEQNHHELAIHVAGLEPDQGSISTYKISTQLSGSIANVTERRLVVKPPSGVAGMTFVPIQPGTFMIGSSEVAVAGFEMQTTDVTQAEWILVMGTNPSHFQSSQYCLKSFGLVNGISGCLDNPVENITAWDVQQFIDKLNGMAKDGYTYRLPTEAEWEYAERAGTTTAYYFGDDPYQLANYAWYGGDEYGNNGNGGGQTHEVAQLKPNAWGLFDMEGDVQQWVRRVHHYCDSPFAIGTRYCDPDDHSLLSVGAGYDNYTQYLRSSLGASPSSLDESSWDLGLRLARARPVARPPVTPASGSGSASASVKSLTFSDVPLDKYGRVIDQTYDQAKTWCESIHGRLPTVAELVDYVKSHAQNVKVVDSAYYPYISSAKSVPLVEDGKLPPGLDAEWKKMLDDGYTPIQDDADQRLIYFKGDSLKGDCSLSGDWASAGSYWTSSEVDVSADFSLLHPFRSTEEARYYLMLPWRECNLGTVKSSDDSETAISTKCVLDLS